MNYSEPFPNQKVFDQQKEYPQSPQQYIPNNQGFPTNNYIQYQVTPMSKIGIIIGIIGAILIGTGLIMGAIFIYKSRYYATSHILLNLFVGMFLLFGIGIILLGIGVGLSKLGKLKQK